MLIIKIIGGLGNQMFQYAYARMLKHKGYDVTIDISGFESYKIHHGYRLDSYAIDLEIAGKMDKDKIGIRGLTLFFEKVKRKFNMPSNKHLIEQSLLFNPSLLEPIDNQLIEGYFQSENYFLEIRELLIAQFVLKEKLSSYSLTVLDEIHKSSVSASLHVRRGDYVNTTNIQYHGCCSLEYYYCAIRTLQESYDEVRYFVFSDDIVWVKEHLEIENAFYVEHTSVHLEHEDIYLMSQCHHHIIANSSFSWWGAWLNQRQDKVVIAPKKWFEDTLKQLQSNDIIPQNWIKL